jgi:hypothetical protein
MFCRRGRREPSLREPIARDLLTRLAEELRAVFGARENNQPRFQPSAAAIEEEAASRLYGERTGTVNASPASPPLRREPPERPHAEHDGRPVAAQDETQDVPSQQADPSPR